MIKVKVGDVVRLKHNIGLVRVCGVYPMNNIPSPDRIDVRQVDDDREPGIEGVGIRLAWVEEIVEAANGEKT